MMRTCKQSLQVAACLALAACAGRAPPPAIEAKIVTVDVPIAVRCIDPARVPTPVPPAIVNGDAVHDSAVLAKTDLALRSWVDQVSTLLPACEVVPAKAAQSSSNP